MTLTQSRMDAEKRFTVEEANRMLPLVRAIIDDLQAQQKVVDDLTSRVNRLKRAAKRPGAENDAEYSAEMQEFEHDLILEVVKRDSFRHELFRLGLLPGEPAGHCDFPSVIDGQEVYLCWMAGESEVLHFHEPYESWVDRRPIFAAADRNE